jgi:hypothetical protein
VLSIVICPTEPKAAAGLSEDVHPHFEGAANFLSRRATTMNAAHRIAGGRVSGVKHQSYRPRRMAEEVVGTRLRSVCKVDHNRQYFY